MTDDQLLDVAEVAQWLRLDEQTVYRMVNSGELPSFKVRRNVRFKRSDIEQWIEAQRRKPADHTR